MSRSRATSWTLTAALLLAAPSVARAQANRVFASARSGNDLNACASINTPCQTLQGAVNQVAAGGVVLVLDSGGYGPLTINKAVTIEAPVGIEAFIHPPSGHAITVQAGSTDVVVLRGLTLSGGPLDGIVFFAGGALHVEKCVIQGFLIGIYMPGQGAGPVYADLYVENTIIRNCNAYGIFASSDSGALRATIERCHLVGNGHGLHGGLNARIAAWDTLAAGNFVGMSLLAAASQTSRMVVERCTADNNQSAGIQADGSIFDSPATLWLSNSTVTGNGSGIMQLDTAQLLSRVNNTVEGNATNISGSTATYSPK